MYGTFRYNKKTKENDHIEISTANGAEARGHTSIACDPCRSRKKKCSGEKGGCGRCLTASIQCTYREASASIEDGNKQLRSSSCETPSVGYSSGVSDRPLEHQFSQLPLPISKCNLNPASSDSNSAAGTMYSADSGSDYLADNSLSSGFDSCWGISFSNDADSYRHGIDDLHHMVTSFPAQVEQTDFLNEPPNRILDPSKLNWTGPSSFRGDPDHSKPLQPNANHQSNFRANETPNPLSQCSIRKDAINCHCVNTIAHCLEVMGSSEVMEIGIDTRLSCLGRGIVACEDVLGCSNCNAGADNSMLLSILVQELELLATGMVEILLGRINYEPTMSKAATDTVTWFGRYRIEVPSLRTRFVYNTVSLHLAHLQGLAARMKDGIWPGGVAWRRIFSTEDKVGRLYVMIQRQLQIEERV